MKYGVLILILGWTWYAATLIVRGLVPCYAILSRGEEAKWTTYLALGLFVVSAFFVSMPFCRWLCPFAAVLNIFSRMGFARIVRSSAACTGCRACSKVCPMGIDVAFAGQVKSPDCFACMECISRCPQRQAKPLQWKLFGRWVIQNAIVEPYYDEQDGRWRTSSFKIQDYDLLEITNEDKK